MNIENLVKSRSETERIKPKGCVNQSLVVVDVVSNSKKKNLRKNSFEY